MGLKINDWDTPCPACGEPLSYDEVDIGVGVMKGNYRCDWCGWYEDTDSVFKTASDIAKEKVGPMKEVIKNGLEKD